MEIWRKLLSYISFKKQEIPGEEKEININLRAMHIINKISIFMFLAAMVFLFVKWVIL